MELPGWDEIDGNRKNASSGSQTSKYEVKTASPEV